MARGKAHSGYIPTRVFIYDLPEIAEDTDGIKLAITPPTSDTTYSGGDLDGTLDALKMYMRVPTVTTSVSAATFNTSDPIVFRGRSAEDKPRQVEVLLTLEGGGETVAPTALDAIGIDKLISIDVPAQLQAAGTMSFGFAAGVRFDNDDPAVSVSTSGGAPREVAISSGDGDIVLLPLPLEVTCEQIFIRLYDNTEGTTADPIMVQV